MASVAFEGVTKRFGDTAAVDHLDLDIADEEFMVLLGPSGCGKTTALRMVAGLETVTEGYVRIGGQVVNEVPARRRDVAMVFQSYALYPHLTVAKNIESPLVAREHPVDGEDRPRKLTKAERTARIREAAQILGLEGFLDRKPAALSGGQRQRVALARAIVTRPRAFLMDEPLSNLDAKLRAQTRTELVELHRRLSATVIYVTHDQVEAMTMATRIAVLADGRLQQVGTPQEIYDRPTNLFVARFIGTPPMDTLAGSFTTDGGPSVKVGGGRIALARNGISGVEEGRPVTVGVRPEHFHVRPDSSSTADGSGLAGRVVNVEWLGHESLVVVDVAGDHRLTVRQSRSGTIATPDSTVTIDVDPDQVHLFDSDSEERLG